MNNVKFARLAVLSLVAVAAFAAASNATAGGTPLVNEPITGAAPVCAYSLLGVCLAWEPAPATQGTCPYQNVSRCPKPIVTTDKR